MRHASLEDALLATLTPLLRRPLLVDADSDCHAIRRQLEHELHDHFELEHTTLQVDHEGGELLTIEMPEQRRPTEP